MIVASQATPKQLARYVYCSKLHFHVLFLEPHVSKLILKGGTNANMAPQYDYWVHVFLPTLQRFFLIPPAQIEYTVKSRGYYPRGGGEVHVVVQPWSKPLVPINLIERGEVIDIYIRSFIAGRVPTHVAHDMVKAAKTVLQALCPNILPHVDHKTDENGVGNGSGILIVAKTTTGCLLAGSALGTPKKHAKEVGTEAANELARSLSEGGCVDEWLQDQLILYMALAVGPSQMLTGSLTLHTQTAIEIAKQVCGATIEVVKLNKSKQETSKGYGKAGLIPGKHLIRCTGISHHMVNQL
jgi:RNA 3'-terminal phosphate cyclase (ATP)